LRMARRMTRTPGMASAAHRMGRQTSRSRRIVNFDSKLPDGAFQLRVSRQQLNGTGVLRALADLRCSCFVAHGQVAHWPGLAREGAASSPGRHQSRCSAREPISGWVHSCRARLRHAIRIRCCSTPKLRPCNRRPPQRQGRRPSLSCGLAARTPRKHQGPGGKRRPTGSA
jgi:hypothetical protein